MGLKTDTWTVIFKHGSPSVGNLTVRAWMANYTLHKTLDAFTYPFPDLGFNSSPCGQNGRHFADDIFRCIFVNEKLCVLIEISLKFIPKSPTDNIFALV